MHSWGRIDSAGGCSLLAGPTRLLDESVCMTAKKEGDTATQNVCLVALGRREPGFGGQIWPRSKEDALKAVFDAAELYL